MVDKEIKDSLRSRIAVVEARPTDLDSLATIVPRSFHPANPYIEKTLPDTPDVRRWWCNVFALEIEDPTCHLLTAIDSSSDKDIGLLALRLLSSDARDVGFWTMYDWPADFERDMFKAMIDSMTEYREKLMMGKPHYLIELFGADHEWKGFGVGKKLLSRVCEIVDAEGHDVFVQANGSAKSFYEQFGFKCEAEAAMPGEREYVEYMMVRRYDQR